VRAVLQLIVRANTSAVAMDQAGHFWRARAGHFSRAAKPGDNLDAMLRAVNSEQSPPTLSFGIAICLVSSRALSLQASHDVARQYGEALRDLVTVNGVEGSQVVGIPIHVRNQVIDSVLFDRWRRTVGYPPGWGGEAWVVFVSADSPREVIEEIQDLQAYASVTRIMHIAGVEDELIPPPRMVGRVSNGSPLASRRAEAHPR
jgi:hypothetical protein